MTAHCLHLQQGEAAKAATGRTVCAVFTLCCSSHPGECVESESTGSLMRLFVKNFLQLSILTGTFKLIW